MTHRRLSREQTLLVATVTIALLALTQMTVIRPALAKTRQLKSKVLASANDAARMRAVANEKARVESMYAEIRTRIASTKTPEREIIDMLLTVERAAQEAGVEVVQNIHIKDEPFPYFNRHTVAFRGKGKPESLMRMVYSLQDPRLLLRIPEMKFAMKNHALEIDLQITRVVCRPERNG